MARFDFFGASDRHTCGRRVLSTLTLSLAMAAPVDAAVIIYGVGGVNIDIPAVAGFATTGALMDGMQVSACFSGIGCETFPWADRAAPNSGGVMGTGWDLSVTGDTFTAPWQFVIDPSIGQLQTLLLDGRTSLVLFDRSSPSPGTSGSEAGNDWDTALNAGTIVNVTYLDPTGVGGAAPLGDIFQQVFVDFGQTGPRTTFSFLQDTDNDARFFTPEPGALALVGVALLALTGVARRRQRM